MQAQAELKLNFCYFLKPTSVPELTEKKRQQQTSRENVPILVPLQV